ncbi:MAG: hypothetical protein O4860_13050, partial [Trichodesmium sp. St2_bin2_1]|nr:hypothetical protein [Trichodesmium sp. St2_bin2_1]
MYASAASQTSPNELLANGSSLRSEAQEFRPAVGTPPQAGTVFDAREWYAPVAAYPPVQFTQYEQPELNGDARPDADEAHASPANPHARAGFVERTARWIHGRARAAACLFVAAVAAIASKRD